MLKRLALIVLLASILPVPGHSDSPKSSSNQNSAEAAKQPPSPPPPIVQCTVKQETSAIQCNWAKGVPEGYFSRLFTAENTPNIALFLAGLGGIFIALFTLRAIKQQVEWMKTQAVQMALQHGEMENQTAVARISAEYALLNTRALISAERAWVVVNIKEITPGVYVFIARNEGKTPAKVQSTYCANLWTPEGKELFIPPDEKTAEGQMQNPPFLLPPAAERSIWQCTRTQVEIFSQGGPGEQSFFARGFGMAHFYGRIRYHNVLETDPTILHETRWFYWLVPVKGSVPFPDPMHPEHNTYS
jgi:hypothetical protein